MTRKRKPSYFVRFITYWQNSPDFFVGPFDSRAEAEAEIERAVNAPRSAVVYGDALTNDLRDGVNVRGVLSFTTARRIGMRDERYGDDNSNVYDDIPVSLSRLPEKEY